MHRLPQGVLGHIYEYDPTYRVDEHQKQMMALVERNSMCDYNWKDLRFMETVSFHFTMCWVGYLIFVIVFPIYTVIIVVRLMFIVLGLGFKLIFRVH